MNVTKTALLFSGQGSQYAEMGKDFHESEIFSLGSEILGFDLVEKINKGEFDCTTVVQPAVFAVSAAAFHAAKDAGIKFDAVVGHSLGEYAALYAAGVFNLEDAFKLLKIRSEIMSEVKGGGMAAVLGLDSKTVEAVCNEINDIEPVNYNSPQQIVIAGSDEALIKAEEVLKTAGAKRVMRLNVAAAFHSEFMRGASIEFLKAVNGFTFKSPEVPFYSNVTGGLLTDFSNMPGYLARHMRSPVRFTDQLFTMENDGFNGFSELGPGKVLSGLVKKTLPNAISCSIEDLKSLEAAKELLIS